MNYNSGNSGSDPETAHLLKSLVASNAKILTELAELRTAIGHQASVPSHAGAAPAHGSSSTSSAIAREILAKNGHGMLGRTNMEDVDRLSSSAKKELDQYLRRTIRAIVPVGITFKGINANEVFPALKAFGLHLEDRGGLLSTPLFVDSENVQAATLKRLENYCSYLYTGGTDKFFNYWQAYALETVYELARYRGLFGADGFLVC